MQQSQGSTERDHLVLEVVDKLRRAFIRTANGAEAMKFEDAVHEAFPFATDWIPLGEDKWND